MQLVPKAVVAERWARYYLKRRPAAPPPAKVRNVGPVLDLGNTTFFVFRGRPFGVPAVPYKLGQQLVELRQAAPPPGVPLDAKNSPPYFAYIRRLPRLLWPHLRPVGRLRRVLKRCGLLRNPLERATEAELVEIADFFLARRMRSGVQFPQAEPQSNGSKTA
jgi:hypothetical protein